MWDVTQGENSLNILSIINILLSTSSDEIIVIQIFWMENIYMDVANRHQKIYKSFHFEFSQSDFITK